MQCQPRRKYRVSRQAREFFSRVWAPQETPFEVGGLEDLGDLDPKIHNKSVFHSADLFPKLEKYFTPTEWVPNHEALTKAIRVARQVFRPVMRIERLSDKARVFRALKLDRNGGAPTFLKKAAAFNEDWVRSQKIASGEQSPPPCVALKRTQHGPNGPKTRLVWAYPQSMTILEAKYAAPIIASFKDFRLMRVIPYYQRKSTLGANLIRLQNRSFRYCLDYSGFDASVPRSLVQAAFDILRDFFVEVDEGEWEAIVRYFVYTEIIMPDFNVYRKTRGIPSGSYFTQLVGSIVNYISLVYAFEVAGVSLHPANIMVLGDDSIVCPSRYVPIAEMARILKTLNLTVNVEKSHVSRGSQPVEFLGHYWPYGLPDRELEEILKRLRFPESWRSTYQKPEERFAAFMADAVGTWRLWNKWTRRPALFVIDQRYPVIRRHIDVGKETGLSRLLESYDSNAVDLAVTGPLL